MNVRPILFFSLFLLSNRICTGRKVDNWASLSEIQKAKEDDPAYQNLGKEACKEAINDLVVYLERQKSHAHVMNKGAACDVLVTMKRLEHEVWLAPSSSILTDYNYCEVPIPPFTHWCGIFCDGYMCQYQWHNPAFMAWIWWCLCLLCWQLENEHMGHVDTVWMVLLFQKIW